MIEDKEKIIEEEEQETEFCVEVSGTFHVMATNEEEAEEFIFNQLSDDRGSGYSYLKMLDITAEGDE
tara:strand:+ start:937 stop:1137 length:201 start_codon:yes stop_codon:yes gene_type:complete